MQKYCLDRDIPVHRGALKTSRDPKQSLEAYWRDERYTFFHTIGLPVVTAHSLDDCVEQWIFSSLHGKPGIIPKANGCTIRPFRLTRKTEFINWCRSRNLKWHEDYSNEDTRFMRNYIRHELLPKALVVNPGLHKVIAKKVQEDA